MGEMEEREALLRRTLYFLGLEGLPDEVRELFFDPSLSPHRLALLIVRRGLELREKGEWRISLTDLAKLVLLVLTNAVVSHEGVGEVCVDEEGKHLRFVVFPPIRVGGGTEAGFMYVVLTYMSALLRLRKFKPSPEYSAMIVDSIFNAWRNGKLQYPLHPEPARFVAENLTVELETKTVWEKGVPLKHGIAIFLNDCVIQKAKKILKILDKLGEHKRDREILEGVEGWLEETKRFFERVAELKEVGEAEKKEGGEGEEGIDYLHPFWMKVNAFGRPFIALQNKYGFLRTYGRAPNTGFASWGFPYTVTYLFGDMLEVGTQLTPSALSKATVLMTLEPSLSLLPPAVILEDGSVVYLWSREVWEEVKGEVKEVLFWGETLISVGEYRENNENLAPAPYSPFFQKAQLIVEFGADEGFAERYSNGDLGVEEYIRHIERGYPFPSGLLHNYSDLKMSTALRVAEKIREAERQGRGEVELSDEEIGELQEGFVPFRVQSRTPTGALVSFDERTKKSFLLIKRLAEEKNYTPDGDEDTLSAIRKMGVTVFDRFPKKAFVGLRVSKPSKAKMRESNKVTGLFPTLHPTGKTRKTGRRKIREAVVRASKSSDGSPFVGSEKRLVECWRGHKFWVPEDPLRAPRKCPKCGSPLKPFDYRTNRASESYDVSGDLKFAFSLHPEYTGVRRIMNLFGAPEPPFKATLRKKHGVFVYRDGTVRFDIVASPLTHINPSAGLPQVTDPGKLREMGYKLDGSWEPIKPQHIILPLSIAEDLLRVVRFLVEEAKTILRMDEGLLERYHLKDKVDVARRIVEELGEIKSIRDLVGLDMIITAPHISVGLRVKVIGFVKQQVFYSHPFSIAFTRRNCDGDISDLAVYFDWLLNSNKTFIPEKEGALLDFLLLVEDKLYPLSVDDEVYNMDAVWFSNYRAIWELFRKSLEGAHPDELEEYKSVESLLNNKEFLEGLEIPFTYPLYADPEKPPHKSKGTLEHVSDIVEYMEKSRSLREKLPFLFSLYLNNHLLRDLRGNISSMLSIFLMRQGSDRGKIPPDLIPEELLKEYTLYLQPLTKRKTYRKAVEELMDAIRRSKSNARLTEHEEKAVSLAEATYSYLEELYDWLEKHLKLKVETLDKFLSKNTEE